MEKNEWDKTTKSSKMERTKKLWYVCLKFSPAIPKHEARLTINFKIFLIFSKILSLKLREFRKPCTKFIILEIKFCFYLRCIKPILKYCIVSLYYFGQYKANVLFLLSLKTSVTQITFTCAKSTLETLEKVKRMFKANNKNTRTMSFEFVLVFLLLTLNISHTFFCCCYCWLWTNKY